MKAPFILVSQWFFECLVVHGASLFIWCTNNTQVLPLSFCFFCLMHQGCTRENFLCIKPRLSGTTKQALHHGNSGIVWEKDNAWTWSRSGVFLRWNDEDITFPPNWFFFLFFWWYPHWDDSHWPRCAGRFLTHLSLVNSSDYKDAPWCDAPE